ncbi:fatty acid alpha-hydroxylase [Martiniozyma asiatica (nom. inval.)]|nr:fatty acid alpha-hydroxylase [Martiniozyma asiatica]
MSSRLPLIAASELEKHNTEKSCWVTLYNRKIYDVTEFLDEHPAGSEVIIEYGGKDITAILQDAISHTHSESAYEMMDEMLIGYLATAEEEEELLLKHPNMEVIPDEDGMKVMDLTEFGEIPDDLLHVKTDHLDDFKKHNFLDLDKPLIMQVLRGNWTREFYIDQIHRPRHYGKGSAQLFGNFLEPLSLTPWWVVPTIWIPVNFYVLYLGVKELNPFLSLFLWLLGLFVWTLIEYCLHRFLFHLDDNLPQHNVAFTLHFLLHGVHHYLPMDRMRLVMPPTLFVVLCYPFYKLVFAIFPYHVACVGFAGGFLGYIIYDVTHYMLHHAKLPKYLQDLKTYHLEHHYKNYQLGFGVSNNFWDHVFGTYLNSDDVLQKNS